METLEEQLLQWLEKYRETVMKKMSSEKKESPLVLFYAGEIIACDRFSKTMDEIIERCKENRTN